MKIYDDDGLRENLKEIKGMTWRNDITLNAWQNLLYDLRRLVEQYGIERIEEALKHLKVAHDFHKPSSKP